LVNAVGVTAPEGGLEQERHARLVLDPVDELTADPSAESVGSDPGTCGRFGSFGSPPFLAHSSFIALSLLVVAFWIVLITAFCIDRDRIPGSSACTTPLSVWLGINWS
jgi:hypothetical protein